MLPGGTSDVVARIAVILFVIEWQQRVLQRQMKVLCLKNVAEGAAVGVEIEHNAHTVEVPGCGGESLHLPLPPHGAWLHMSREDVREFGKAKFVAANFLDIYGRFFRWLALLIAAVTSS